MHKKIGPYKGTRSGFSAIRSRIPADGSPSFVKPVVEDEKRGRAVYQEMAEVVSAECERHDSLLPGVAQNGFPLRPGLGTSLRHQAGTLPGGLLPRFGQHAFPLLGSRAEDVRAFGFGLHPHHAFLRLDFGELLAGFPRRIELNGESGTIILEEDRIVKWEVAGDSAYHIYEQEPAPEVRSHSEAGAIDPSGHVAQLRNFIDAVRGEGTLLVDEAEGRKALALVLAAYRSAAEGKPVVL